MSTIPIYEHDKYVTTSNNLKSTLETYGVAIIEGVLTPSECLAMTNGMWDTFEYLTKGFATPVDRTKKKTWSTFYELHPLHSMMIQNWGIGQAQYVWDLRQNPKIVDIFAEVWNVERTELLTSFDGVSVHFPPESTTIGYYSDSSKSWLHTDQSFTRTEFDAMQGWVTAEDVEDGDATLTVLEGSHKLHADCGKHFDITTVSDWNVLTKEMIQFYKTGGCTQKWIKCKAGSMVFWDSRTVHCGVESFKHRANPKMRNVAYVCMTPRYKATPQELEKKVKAFQEGRTTTHYPHKIQLFPNRPRFASKELELPKLPSPKLTPLGQLLSGVSSMSSVSSV